MTWRIEQSDALALLRELPAEWAQTCIAYPPASAEPDQILAMFMQVRRVLRADGTLWLFTHRAAQPSVELNAQGWIEQRLPLWARPLELGTDCPVSLSLFTKQARYFHITHALTKHRPGVLCAARLEVQRCADGREAIRRVVARCVLASTSPVACGACGTPYCWIEPGEHEGGSRSPTCLHHNPRGRCLVLDPFYTPTNGTLEAAHCRERSFLGIINSEPSERP
jgi:hypothetical protein